VVGELCVASGLALLIMVIGTAQLSAQAPGGGIAGGLPPTPPRPLASLKTASVPEPPELFQYVQDRAAAIQLGKALFWDVQVGSDGATACATCHFQAGADSRTRNILNPGPDSVFRLRGPNATLTADDFPLHKLADVNDAASSVVSDSNDVVGAEGVFNRTFNATPPSGAPDPAADMCTEVPDPVFHVGGSDVRRVTGRHVPSAVNAVFNFRNFWDGRASNVFNGVSPFGPRDTSARVFKLIGGSLQPTQIAIQNASLASQATGPGLSATEMSCDGRVWSNVGHKLLGLVPLGKQQVDPTDSVLGALANSRARPGAPGLQVTYADLIKKAFRPEFWSATDSVTLGGRQFSQMEADFSLFWGLAVEAYESTLVSDDSPVDQYFDGNRNALSKQQVDGLGIFTGKGHCDTCHGGAELTNASVSNVTSQRLERMAMGDDGCAIYDNGFYNIGVRPTAEDLGVGGADPFGNPLSESRMALLGKFVDTTLAPALQQVPACDGRTAVDGAFKVPGLRNVELIGPYFHNGGKATLRQVVDFYNRGGDFATQNVANLDADIKPLQLGEDEKNSLVAFLVGLTDERVRWQRAPFDHPALCVPNGAAGDATSVLPGAVQGEAADNVMCLPAVGAQGASVALQPFLGLNPAQGAASAVPVSPPAPTPAPVPVVPKAPAPLPAPVVTAPPAPPAAPVVAPAPAPVAPPLPAPVAAPAPGPVTAPVAVGVPSLASPAPPSPAPPSPAATPVAAAAHPAAPAARRARAPEPATESPLAAVAAPAAVAPPNAAPAMPLPVAAPAAPQPAEPTAPDASPATATPTAAAGSDATLTPALSRGEREDDAGATATTVVIDAATGGTLATPDGAVHIAVPAGQADTLTLTLAELPPSNTDPNNLQISGRRYDLTVYDSTGAAVTSFDPPLVVTFRPDPALLAAGNLDALVLQVMNPDTGSLDQLATTVTDETRLTASLAALGASAQIGAPAGPPAGVFNALDNSDTGSDDPLADAA
jgi:cytochrome c peroxidase